MESPILENSYMKNVATALVAGIEVIGLALFALIAVSCSNAKAEEKKPGLGTYQWESGSFKISCEEKTPDACLQAAEALKEAEKYRRIVREYEEMKREMGEIMPRNIRGPASRI